MDKTRIWNGEEYTTLEVMEWTQGGYLPDISHMFTDDLAWDPERQCHVVLHYDGGPYPKEDLVDDIRAFFAEVRDDSGNEVCVWIDGERQDDE